MALSIKRGFSNDPINKVDRAVTMYDLTNADIKDTTDIVNPSLIVNVPVASKTDYYTKTNVIYIDAFKRWYNVDNIEFENANRIVYKCSCDVLKTFSADIKSNSYFVSRQENEHNPNIPDPLVPKEAYQHRLLSISTDVIANPYNMSIVIITSSYVGFTANIMDYDSYFHLMNELWGIDFDLLFQKNPIENIIRVFALPWNVNTLKTIFTDGTPKDSIIIGEKTITPNDYTAYQHLCALDRDSERVVYTEIDFPLNSANNEWKHKDTLYRLILPYAGEITIPAGDVYPFSDAIQRAIPIEYILDITSGDILVNIATYKTESGSLISRTIRGNAAIELPMSAGNATQRVVSAIGGGAMSALGIAAAAANPEISGVALAGMGLAAVTQQMSAQMQSSSITGSIGGTLSWAQPQKIYLYTYDDKYVEAAGFAHANGKPLYANKSGNALSGFTKCENVQMIFSGSPSPTDSEKQQLKSLLESGVLF